MFLCSSAFTTLLVKSSQRSPRRSRQQAFHLEQEVGVTERSIHTAWNLMHQISFTKTGRVSMVQKGSKDLPPNKSETSRWLALLIPPLTAQRTIHRLFSLRHVSNFGPCPPVGLSRALKGADGLRRSHSVWFSRPAPRSRARIRSWSSVSAASCASCSDTAQAAASSTGREVELSWGCTLLKWNPKGPQKGDSMRSFRGSMSIRGKDDKRSGTTSTWNIIGPF